MKKIFPLLALIIITIMTFSIQIFADDGDFLIVDGVLVEYTGTSADVSIPESVNTIQVGAFKSGTMKSITIKSKDCVIVAGALPSGVVVHGYTGSTAESAANASGNKFVPLDAKVYHTLTIEYVYSNGEAVAAPHTQSVEENASYSVTSPQIDGYTADKSVVSGAMGKSDTTVKVIYKKNIDSGWKIEGKYIRYYDSSISSYLANTSRTIDGVNRSFDGNGNLIASGDFVTVGSSTYYMVNNSIFSGYVRIGDGIYYFDSSGTMLKNNSMDGYTFDSSGRMTSTKQLITLSGVTYYLINNTLFSGYCTIDDGIYFFGSDYAMATSGTRDGYTFDSNGRITSGIAVSSLDVRYEQTLNFNGMAQKPPVEVYFRGLKLTEGVHYTVSYSDNTTPGVGSIIITGLSPVSGSVGHNFEIVGKDSYTLTIRYLDLDGREVADSYKAEMKPGEDYYVESPEIDGFKSNRSIVSGTMGYEDADITVSYKADAAATDTDTDKATGGTEPETEKKEDKEYDKKVKVTYSYNYKLWIIVVVISTVVAAGLIVVVIKNKQIKQLITALIERVRGKKTPVKQTAPKQPRENVEKAQTPKDVNNKIPFEDDIDMKTCEFTIRGDRETGKEVSDDMWISGENAPSRKRPKKRFYYKKK